MLVLSRRADQQIVFPNLDIKVEVLNVKGKVVKLGVIAPKDVWVMRPEACEKGQLERLKREFESNSAADRHQLRNRLNTINLGLHMLKKQNAVGMHDKSEATIERIIAELRFLDDEVGTAREKVRQASRTKAMRLLVVEDDLNERELLAGLLRLHGFHVDAVADGSEAFEYLDSNEAPDYVLMDMNMPNVDGPTALRRIRGDSRLANLKVLGISGADPESLDLSSDVDGWFPKPLDPGQLISAITASDTAVQVSA